MNYYRAKISVRLQNLFARRNACDGTVITNSSRHFSEYAGVLFFFREPLFMHYGDQLYFKPLIKRLAEHDIRVAVQPTEEIAFVFDRYLHERDGDLSKYLVVTRSDLLSSVRRSFGPRQEYFLFDTNSMRIRTPISNHILTTFARHFDLRLPTRIAAGDYIDFPTDSTDRFGLSDHPGILVLNNYVDSGRHRVTKSMQRQLINAARQAKGKTFVVHVGSRRDAERDAADYGDLVDLDLRGRTSLRDLFSILSMPNVVRVFCHDTIVLHIANFYNRRVSVVFKRYFRPGENAQKRTACASLFEKDRSNIDSLN